MNPREKPRSLRRVTVQPQNLTRISPQSLRQRKCRWGPPQDPRAREAIPTPGLALQPLDPSHAPEVTKENDSPKRFELVNRRMRLPPSPRMSLTAGFHSKLTN